MDDDRIERLMRGYLLPEPSPELDQRVLQDGTEILARARTGEALEDVGRSLLDRLGFGYLAWLADFITTTDAEYRVVIF